MSSSPPQLNPVSGRCCDAPTAIDARLRRDASHHLVEVRRATARRSNLTRDDGGCTRRLSTPLRIEAEVDAIQAPQRRRHQSRADDEHHRERDLATTSARRVASPARSAAALRGHAKRAVGIDARREQRRRDTEHESDDDRDRGRRSSTRQSTDTDCRERQRRRKNRLQPANARDAERGAERAADERRRSGSARAAVARSVRATRRARGAPRARAGGRSRARAADCRRSRRR